MTFDGIAMHEFRNAAGAAGRFSRRGLLSGAGATIAACLAAEQGAAQLLDPSRIGRANASPLVANSPGPSYARSMAASTTSALMSLVSAYANSAVKTDGLKKQERDLRQSLANQVANKEAELDEVRRGQFCSGCMKTRRQILSEGDNFPHPGQRVVAATPEQIAAKERQLDSAIDGTRQKLADVVKQIPPSEVDLTRIKNEIFEGGLLWRSAVTYQDALILQADGDAERDYQAQRAEITRKVKDIQSREPNELDTLLRKRMADELTTLTATLNSLDSRRQTQRRGVQIQLQNSEQAARAEGGRFASHVTASAAKIVDGGKRGYLEINSMMLSKNPVSGATGGGRSTGGRMFQMGDYSPATWGAIRPDVAQFLDRAGLPYRNAPGAYYPSLRDELELMRTLIARLSQPHPNAPTPEPEPAA